jgi:transketolase C-terminal domain/subunit
MKKELFDYMLEVMKNEDVYLIFCGLGWPRVDEYIKLFPDRAINVEASEQTACDIAVGLAYEGKIPVIYTITPFYLRAFETLRTYFDHENLHVVMVGAGRDDDYSKHDGFSHEAGDIHEILSTLHNVKQLYPNSVDQMKEYVDHAVNFKSPWFISISK